MIESFHGFVMFSLSSSKIGWILFRNAKEILKEMLARKCSYRGTGRQTYEGLKISVNSIIEATQFLLWHQVKYVLTECFCQGPLENWFGRQRFLGSRKDNPSMADFQYNNAILYCKPKKNSNQSLLVMLLIVAWLP